MLCFVTDKLIEQSNIEFMCAIKRMDDSPLMFGLYAGLGVPNIHEPGVHTLQMWQISHNTAQHCSKRAYLCKKDKCCTKPHILRDCSTHLSRCHHQSRHHCDSKIQAQGELLEKETNFPSF